MRYALFSPSEVLASPEHRTLAAVQGAYCGLRQGWPGGLEVMERNFGAVEA
ncbi:hypothetical protein [Paenibacillus sp. NPDC057934]|uniref:hypothetical protein n=1 Tax=Paenibacillus sp. NPDC057934 TaxID=3346282 RepID=UPI0036DE9F91